MNTYIYATLINNPKNERTAHQVIASFVEEDLRTPETATYYQNQLKQLEGLGEQALAERLRRDFADKL